MTIDSDDLNLTVVRPVVEAHAARPTLDYPLDADGLPQYVHCRCQPTATMPMTTDHHREHLALMVSRAVALRVNHDG